jgi:hypothetical protein
LEAGAISPTVSSAAEIGSVIGPAGPLWEQVEHSWSLVARSVGRFSPVIQHRLRRPFPSQAHRLSTPDGDFLLHHSSGEWCFQYPDGLACRIAAGDPISIEFQAFSPTSIEHFTRLSGPLTAMVMDLSDCYPLHAAGIGLGDRMIALHGRSGTGKSTIAALVAGAGLGIAGDDLLPLDDHGRIAGAGGALRIAPERAPESWQPLGHLPDGRGWYPLPPLPTLPLAAVLLLERGERLELAPVRGADRIRAMLRIGFLSHLDPAPPPAWHERIVALSGQVAVHRLVVPDSLAALTDQRDRLISMLRDQ